MNITRGLQTPSAVKVVLYGPEGIGKSTLASKFPAPVFIDTEGSTKYLDVDRFDAPTSWEMLLSEVRYIRDNPGIYKTLVIDTADWAEKLCTDAVLDTRKLKSVEDAGYGKGYVYVYEEFGKLLNLLTEVCNAGVNCVVTAHASMRKFEQPDEQGAYDRWELKLSKKVAPLVKEWADMVFFCNYKTILIEDTKTKSFKAHGGERVLYTSHHNCWDAKCRANLPPMLPMTWESISAVIPGSGSIGQPVLTPPPAPVPPPPPPQTQPQPEINSEVQSFLQDGASYSDDDPSWTMVPPPGAGPALLKLYDLLRTENIYPAEVEGAVYERGYYPEGVPLSQMDPEFVEGCLIGGWSQLKEMILQSRIAR